MTERTENATMNTTDDLAALELVAAGITPPGMTEAEAAALALAVHTEGVQ